MEIKVENLETGKKKIKRNNLKIQKFHFILQTIIMNKSAYTTERRTYRF